MRQKNRRLVIMGAALLVMPKSSDPAALMQTVGQVSGVVGGSAVVMLVIRLIGKKRDS